MRTSTLKHDGPSSWKIKVFFPLLDFNVGSVVDQMMKQALKRIDHDNLITPIFDDFETRGYGWVPIESNKTLNWTHIA